MVCPLCKAEYRDGFSVCHDCHIPLAPADSARSIPVIRLWKGDRQHKLDAILGALDAASIASHHKEIVNVRPTITVFGISLTPRQSTFQYEIWVFQSDLQRAQSAIENLR